MSKSYPLALYHCVSILLRATDDMALEPTFFIYSRHRTVKFQLPHQVFLNVQLWFQVQ